MANDLIMTLCMCHIHTWSLVVNGDGVLYLYDPPNSCQTGDFRLYIDQLVECCARTSIIMMTSHHASILPIAHHASTC